MSKSSEHQTTVASLRRLQRKVTSTKTSPSACAVVIKSRTRQLRLPWLKLYANADQRSHAKRSFAESGVQRIRDVWNYGTGIRKFFLTARIIRRPRARCAPTRMNLSTQR